MSDTDTDKIDAFNMAHMQEWHEQKAAGELTKGAEGEICNRTDCCTGMPATFRHIDLDKWYCTVCAHHIADACRFDGFKLFSFMPDVTQRQVGDE